MQRRCKDSDTGSENMCRMQDSKLEGLIVPVSEGHGVSGDGGFPTLLIPSLEPRWAQKVMLNVKRSSNESSRRFWWASTRKRGTSHGPWRRL